MPILLPNPAGGSDGTHILTVRGIPVFVSSGHLIFLGLISFLAIQDGYAPPQVGLRAFIFFISVLLHEMGHALVADLMRCSGIKIVLVAFGGFATHSPTSPERSLGIALAGPAVSLLLGGIACILLLTPVSNLGPEGAMHFVLLNVALLNLFWGFFNLIPIYPMDGGQALYHLLSIRIFSNTALLFVTRLSMALCVVVGLIGYQVLRMPIISLFCLSFFFTNWQIHSALTKSN